MTAVFTGSFQKLIKVKYIQYQGRAELKSNLVTMPFVGSPSHFYASVTSGKYL